MGIITHNKEEKQLYTAYGMTVFGTENKYDWTIYPDKSTENVYTSLRIVKNRDDIFQICLGNRCIFEENFNRTIDNFLWWIDKDVPDSYSIEKAVFKSLTQTDSLFNHLIGNRKRQEQQDKDYEAKRNAIIAEEERKLGEIGEYCRKKNLVFKKHYEKMYLIKILNEKIKEMVVDADIHKLEWLVEFMHEHPDNTDAVIVIEGELDEIMDKIGRR